MNKIKYIAPAFLLTGLLAIVFLATPLAVQAQGTTCKETGAEGTVQANCNGREIGGGWGGFLGLGNKYCCVPAAEGTYDPEKNQVECQVVACGNVRECEIGSPGQACQPPALEGSPCRDPDRERWGVCRIISEKLNTCACEFRDELGAYRDVETGGAGHLETPVVEQEFSILQTLTKPFVALWNFGANLWGRIFGMPIVLSDWLLVAIDDAGKIFEEDSNAIIIALDVLAKAEKNLKETQADPKATEEDKKEAQQKVDKALKDAEIAAEFAQKDLIVAGENINNAIQTAQKTYAEMGSAPVQYAQKQADIVNKEIDDSKQHLADSNQKLKDKDIKAAITAGEKGTEKLDKLVQLIINKIAENQKNTEKVQKVIDRKVEKLANNLNELNVQAQKIQEKPTVKNLKDLQGTLAALIVASNKIGQITQKTGYTDAQVRNLVEGIKIFKEAQTILEIPSRIAVALLADESSKEQMKRWANVVQGAAEISQQAANDILFDTVTVFLTVPGEPTPAEQAKQALQDATGAFAVAAQAAQTAARVGAPEVLKVTLEPVSEEAFRLLSRYEIKFISVKGLLSDLKRLQASTHRTGGEDVTVTAMVTIKGTTYRATNLLEKVPQVPSIRQVEITGLPTDLEGEGTATFLIESSSGKAGFLPP